MMSDWVDQLRERSKFDNQVIVGSEVRELCDEIVTLRAKLAETDKERDQYKQWMYDAEHKAGQRWHGQCAAEDKLTESLNALSALIQAADVFSAAVCADETAGMVRLGIELDHALTSARTHLAKETK
jgi:hypothetical protein